MADYKKRKRYAVEEGAGYRKGYENRAGDVCERVLTFTPVDIYKAQAHRFQIVGR